MLRRGQALPSPSRRSGQRGKVAAPSSSYCVWQLGCSWLWRLVAHPAEAPILAAAAAAAPWPR
jgi:hypothetical protein